MGVNSPVASLFSAGESGAGQDRIWRAHFPLSFASAPCSGPGVAALVCASMARSAADLPPASCALADPTNAASAPAVERHATAAKLDDFMAILPWNGCQPGSEAPGRGKIVLASTAFQQRLHRQAFQQLAVVLIQIDEGHAQLSGAAPDHLGLHQQRDLALRHPDGE